MRMVVGAMMARQVVDLAVAQVVVRRRLHTPMGCHRVVDLVVPCLHCRVHMGCPQVSFPDYRGCH